MAHNLFISSNFWMVPNTFVPFPVKMDLLICENILGKLRVHVAKYLEIFIPAQNAELNFFWIIKYSAVSVFSAMFRIKGAAKHSFAVENVSCRCLTREWVNPLTIPSRYHILTYQISDGDISRRDGWSYAKNLPNFRFCSRISIHGLKINLVFTITI